MFLRVLAELRAHVGRHLLDGSAGVLESRVVGDALPESSSSLHLALGRAYRNAWPPVPEGLAGLARRVRPRLGGEAGDSGGCGLFASHLEVGARG